MGKSTINGKLHFWNPPILFTKKSPTPLSTPGIQVWWIQPRWPLGLFDGPRHGPALQGRKGHGGLGRPAVGMYVS